MKLTVKLVFLSLLTLQLFAGKKYPDDVSCDPNYIVGVKDNKYICKYVDVSQVVAACTAGSGKSDCTKSGRTVETVNGNPKRYNCPVKANEQYRVWNSGSWGAWTNGSSFVAETGSTPKKWQIRPDGDETCAPDKDPDCNAMAFGGSYDCTTDPSKCLDVPSCTDSTLGCYSGVLQQNGETITKCVTSTNYLRDAKCSCAEYKSCTLNTYPIGGGPGGFPGFIPGTTGIQCSTVTCDKKSGAPSHAACDSSASGGQLLHATCSCSM